MADQDLTYILNKGMKVFSQLYVGLSGTLGFATPYEDNAAFRKRKATVDSWCCGSVLENGRYVPKPGKTEIIDNIPREGFKITDDVKRVYWGGGNIVWRVLDPYGFELEIQSANLLAIINTAGLKAGGEIPGKCLWGRDGKDNILLHESSQEYQTAILAAETIKKPKTVGSNDRMVGHKYLLMDGSQGIYLGKFWVTKQLNAELVKKMDIPHDWNIRNVKVGVSVTHALPVPHVLGDLAEFEAVLFDSHGGGRITLYKKAPLVREETSNTYLTEEAILQRAKTAGLQFASPAIKGVPVVITRHKPTDLTWVTEPIKLSDAIDDWSWRSMVSEYERNENYRKEYPNNNITKWAPNFENILCFGKCLIDEEGNLYTDAEHVVPSYRNNNAPASNRVGPILIEGSKMTVFSFRETRYNYGRRGVNYPHVPRADVSADALKGIQIPSFNSPQELKTWLVEMIEKGKIVKMVPVAK